MTTAPVKITKIRKIQKPSVVCDVTVADNHNLFVCDGISNSPVLAHNCALVEQTHDIEIAGWALLYIARDDPLKTFEIVGDEVTAKQKAKILKKIRSYDRQWDVVQSASSASDIDYLIANKTCKTVEFYNEFMRGFNGCPLESVCFTKQLKTVCADLFL